MVEKNLSVDSILETSKEFNAAAERAREILLALDNDLQKAGIGTSLDLENATHEEKIGGRRYHYDLGYDKTDEGWAICVSKYYVTDAADPNYPSIDHPTVYPLRSASRGLRLEFIQHVPRLLEALRQKAEEHRDLARSRRDLLDTLERQAGSPPSKAPF